MNTAETAVSERRSYETPLREREERKRPDGCVIAGVYLTDREYHTLRLIGEGRLNKQIAEDLGISEKTVEKFRGTGMRKVGARGVADVVRWALRNGVVAMRPAPLGEEWRELDMTMKTSTWVCIGWSRQSGAVVLKQLRTKEPVLEKQALEAFKRQDPSLSRHAVRAGRMMPAERPGN